MKKNECIFCGKILSPNEKLEHIIPNALGGKLKSANIVCSQCNNDFSYLDKELAEDLAPLTSLLRLKKDNGKIGRSICSIGGLSGEILNDGSIKANALKIKKEGKNLIISGSLIHTPSSQAEKENMDRLNKILKSAINNPDQLLLAQKRLQEQIDVNTKTISRPIVGCSLQINKNGTLMLEMLKIITEYYASFNKYDIQYISNAINILKNKNTTDANKIANYYNWQDWRTYGGIYHILCLKGDCTNRILYGIVSLYSILDIFILLNNNYNGPTISEIYSWNVKNSKPGTLSISLPTLNKDQAHNILKLKYDLKNTEEKYQYFLSHVIISPLNQEIIGALKELNNTVFGTEKVLEETNFSETIKKICLDVLSNKLDWFNSMSTEKKVKIVNAICQNIPELQTYKTYLKAKQDEKIRKEKIYSIYCNILKKIITPDILGNLSKLKNMMLQEINTYPYDDISIKQWILDNKAMFLNLLENVLAPHHNETEND